MSQFQISLREDLDYDDSRFFEVSKDRRTVIMSVDSGRLTVHKLDHPIVSHALTVQRETHITELARLTFEI